MCRIGFTTTSVCVALFFVAAAFLAYCAKPGHRGAVIERLYAGVLLEFDEVPHPEDGPRIDVRVLDGGRVAFDRIAVAGLTATGADSLAVSIKGGDVEIKERVSAGYPNDRAMAGASFVTDMSGREWLHVLWSDDDAGLWAAFTLHVREGISFSVKLHS